MESGGDQILWMSFWKRVVISFSDDSHSILFVTVDVSHAVTRCVIYITSYKVKVNLLYP